MTTEVQKKIGGWGRVSNTYTRLITPDTISELIRVLPEQSTIARGNGRSYGDSAVGLDSTISMKKINKILTFDIRNGTLVAEAGTLLSQILECCIPQGWFPNVVPGTKYVSLGGMIAANVHGKNHCSSGSFGNSILWLDLLTKEGDVYRCSRTSNSELFNWTIGGMGLTGIIIRAEIELRPIETCWMVRHSNFTYRLEDLIDGFDDTRSAEYSVAWIDPKYYDGIDIKAILFTADHAAVDDLPFKTPHPLRRNKGNPWSIPNFLRLQIINSFSIKIFNLVYYFMRKFGSQKQIIRLDKFFFPLDSVSDWNRIYGKRGLLQYQLVFPAKTSYVGLRMIFDAINESGFNSFVCVLKKFGTDDFEFAFPTEGFSLAIDFPADIEVYSLLEHLDQIVLENQGRFYLAKDVRMSKHIFWKADERAQKFQKFRESNNLSSSFQSVQSVRLGL